MQGGPSRHRESKDKARRTIMSYLQCQYIKSTEPLTSNEDEADGTRMDVGSHDHWWVGAYTQAHPHLERLSMPSSHSRT